MNENQLRPLSRYADFCLLLTLTLTTPAALYVYTISEKSVSFSDTRSVAENRKRVEYMFVVQIYEKNEIIANISKKIVRKYSYSVLLGVFRRFSGPVVR